jgi:hypothetical protein
MAIVNTTQTQDRLESFGIYQLTNTINTIEAKQRRVTSASSPVTRHPSPVTSP